jgi:hypothetical protein
MTNRKVSLATSSERSVIAATPTKLQIDLDSPKALRSHAYYYHLLEREGLTVGWVSTYYQSRTMNHFHCIITLPKPLQVETRILLQTLLGSHLQREIYNYIRVLRGAPLPIVFFRSKKNV